MHRGEHSRYILGGEWKMHVIDVCSNILIGASRCSMWACERG